MEKLFSYGTLQLKKVQLNIFKRILQGKKDTLLFYKKKVIKILDQSVINSSGTDKHPIIYYSGNKNDYIKGILFEISKDELLKADTYEVNNYKRVKVIFESGNYG
tara:strand:+ start:43 stop:357 length:315 start_codon:yes stop_codon:yes gene_type:complete